MPNINSDIKITQIHSTLWEIQDVLTEECLADLQRYFDYGTEWHMDRKLSRLSHPIGNDQDPFRDLGFEFAPVVAQAIGQEIWYRKAKLFLDLPGSEVPLHSDADNIDVMSQVYLMKSDHPVPGTMFLQPVLHTVKYRYNCGYLNLNTDRKIHQSPFVINGYRTSLGFQFYFPK
jgi:hypothetical protein